jgi:hypothetical protein
MTPHKNSVPVGPDIRVVIVIPVSLGSFLSVSADARTGKVLEGGRFLSYGATTRVAGALALHIVRSRSFRSRR